ncbi:MAG: archaeosortase H [Promethearchaeota archaeon]
MTNNEKPKKKRPIIEFEGKKYIFSNRSLLILIIGTPLLSILIYMFFDNQANYWLHEIVVKQTVFFLNLFFNMGASAHYAPVGKYHWYFSIPGRPGIFFETFCTGIQAICVFAGIIICTPHSQDPYTNEDIIWRKTKSLVVSSFLFYVVNIIRMIIQLYLYYLGYAWEDIHYSISAASSFIAAIIILLLHKWIPEFIISIIYMGTLVSEPIKEKRKEKAKTAARNSNKVELELMRKALGLNKIIFKDNFHKMASHHGFQIEGLYLLVPEDKYSSFLKCLDNKFEIKKKVESD